MTQATEFTDPLREAAGRFETYVTNWPAGVESESGLTRVDAQTVAGHIDLVLLLRSRDIPPLTPVPEDQSVLTTAFDHLNALRAAWPADRIDPASRLTRNDLDLIARERAPVFPRREEPEGPNITTGPPDIVDEQS